jgi:hypothetical protein
MTKQRGSGGGLSRIIQKLDTPMLNSGASNGQLNLALPTISPGY